MLAAAGDAATRCERALQVARQSKCPSSAWKDVLMPHLWVDEPSHGPLIYVNAGANKGFAVAEFLQRFHDDRDRSPSNREWHRSIKQIKPSGMFGCGMCAACKEAKPPAHLRRNASVRVFAFELLKPNHWLLTRLFERYSVPGATYLAAVSNFTGTAYAPTGVRTGQEWETAGFGDAKRTRSRAWAAVPSTTVDAFAQREQIERVHWLSVDAEGWDALILEGATRLLAARRIDLLEFEYHSKGMWASTLRHGERRDLRASLLTLESYGFACFWQGAKGAIAEASGGAWCDAFEFRAHSNLVCSHVPHLVRLLRSLDQTANLPAGRRQPHGEGVSGGRRV